MGEEMDKVGAQEERNDTFTTAERRPSVIKLQGMLKRVSSNPFSSRYMSPAQSSSLSSETSINPAQSGQDSRIRFDLSSASSVFDTQPITTPVNPFLPAAQSETVVTPWNPFSSPSENSGIVTVDKENNVLSNTKSLNFTSGLNSGFLQSPVSSRALSDLQPDKPVSLERSGAIFPIHWESKLGQSSTADRDSEVFKTFPGKGESAVLHSTPTGQSPVHSDGKDFLLEYILSQQADSVVKSEMTPSDWPAVLDTTPDPPGVPKTPSVMTNFQPAPFETPDAFQATPTSGTSDIFQIPYSSVVPQELQSPDWLQTSVSTPPSFRAHDSYPGTSTGAQNVAQTKPSNNGFDILLTTPGGTEKDILNTPSELKSAMVKLSSTETDSPINPSASITQIGTFKRRPPKPSPRSKFRGTPSQTASPHTTSTPSPTPNPAPRSEIKTQDAMFEAKQDVSVYEDVLLIGQERCVEDWPEDSPEFNPEWKPAGKLRLRRESMRLASDSDGDFGAENQKKKHGKSTLGRKLRSSILSRSGSKNKNGEEAKKGKITLRRKSKENFFEDKENTLPRGLKDKTLSDLKGAEGSSSPQINKKDGADKVFSQEDADSHTSGENEGGKQEEMKDCRPKRPSIFKPLMPRKLSKESFAGDLKKMDGHTFEDSTDAFQGVNSGEDEGKNEKEENLDMSDNQGRKPRKKVKIQFVPHRGYAIRLTKDSGNVEETQGAHGYTPSPKESHSFDELKGAHGYTTPSKFKENETEKIDKIPIESDFSPYDWKDATFQETKGAVGYTPSWKRDEDFVKGVSHFMSRESGRQGEETKDYTPRKLVRSKQPLSKRSEDNPGDHFQQKGADLFKAGDLDDKEPHEQIDNSLQRGARKSHPETHHGASKGSDLFKAGDYGDEEDEERDASCSQQRRTPLSRVSQSNNDLLMEDPPGATSSDYYLSEAAKAEWWSSQMDIRKANAVGDEERLQGVTEEEEEGDTDSLMEWWNTVELWDELPSDEEINLKEDEEKSFTDMAEKVHRGLNVFNKVYTERAEILYHHILLLHAIADDISSFHKRAKRANIGGGTTVAVGGVTAIAGLVLAPFTFGTSLIVSAIGLTVATAGGITSASAAISDNVNNMQDRKKIELVVEDYLARLVDLTRSIRFVREGLQRLRRHPLLRRNNYYAGDWEVRRALQMVSLASEPAERAKELMENATTTLNSLFKGMDKYFTKDTREMKKECKKEVTAKVRSLAQQLQEGLMELNDIRGQLLEASGNI